MISSRWEISQEETISQMKGKGGTYQADGEDYSSPPAWFKLDLKWQAS